MAEGLNNPDFITAFREWCGETEAPESYIQWAALSLLAASCGNRIYTKRQFGNDFFKVVPNLYVVTLGPSSNYKSFAQKKVFRILDAIDYSESLSVFRGHITMAGMVDMMNSEHWMTDADGTRHKSVQLWKKHLYLINDELAACAGNAEFADLFVRYLTAMYFGDCFEDATRTHGHVKLQDFTLNWWATTTVEWLVRSVNPDNLEAGFFRRIIAVNADYSHKRIWRPRVNPKTNVLFEYLCKRVEELLITTQYIKWTDEADRIAHNWYMSLEEPAIDDRIGSSYRDQIGLVVKLAVLLAVSQHQTFIDDEIVSDAISLSNQTLKWKRQIEPLLTRGVKGRTEDDLLSLIQARKQIQRTALTKAAYNKHVKAGELKGLLDTWIQAGLIEEHRRAPNKGGIVYVAK